jgi:hypothetical protein
MFNFTLTTPVSLIISLAALAGVTLHDTKIDKLATAFAGIPAMMTTAENNNRGFGDQHTHVERISLNDMNSSQPRTMARSDQKKHMIQKNAPKGTHRFDGYTLPIA